MDRLTASWSCAGRVPPNAQGQESRGEQCYELLNAGLIESAVIKQKNARTGIRLIDMQSVENFLRANTH